MRVHRLLPLVSLLLLVTLLLLACAGGNSRPTTPAASPSASAVSVDGGSVQLISARLQQSYQTHYLMFYPPEGKLFLQVTVDLQGLDDPERWLEHSLTIVYQGTTLDASHVRRRLVGDDYEYRAGEDFAFVYELFFPVEADFQPGAAEVWLASGPIASVADLLPSTSLTGTTAVTPVAGTVLSGEDNDSLGPSALIAGGSHNRTSATHATVAGGQFNLAAAAHATISGGRENQATSFFSFVGGGFANTAAARETTVAGGSRNAALGRYATIGGGIQNQATAANSTVGGGANNSARGVYAGVSAGVRNSATGDAAAVGGGAGNAAAGSQASVLGGLNNQAGGAYSTIGGGLENQANGRFSQVPGGSGNRADADYSLATGRQAHVDQEHTGTFLFADSTDEPFESEAANEFAIRASGGVRLISAVDDSGNPTAGVMLAPGSGSWSMLSDRAAKADFEAVDPSDILQKVVALPVLRWRYGGQPSSVRHIGPTAQDFSDAFGLGEDRQHISAIDADGVALASIQALASQLRSQAGQLEQQQQQLAELRLQIESIDSHQEQHASNQMIQLLLAAAFGSLLTLGSSQLRAKHAAGHDSAI